MWTSREVYTVARLATHGVRRAPDPLSVTKLTRPALVL